jgi:hypothetical protein
MNATNATNDYNDGLDGDSLACKPGDAAAGLETFCTIGLPILGSVLVLNGAWFLYLSSIQRRRKRALQRQVSQIQDLSSVAVRKLHTDRAALQYLERLFLALGTAVFNYGLLYLVYGVGLVYPTTHIRGQIGDFLGELVGGRRVCIPPWW